MDNRDELVHLVKQADRILKDELDNAGIDRRLATTRIYNAKRVGVQGDARTYGCPIEIELLQKGEFYWDDEQFLRRLSTRITNEVAPKEAGGTGVNTVLYVLATDAREASR